MKKIVSNKDRVETISIKEAIESHKPLFAVDKYGNLAGLIINAYGGNRDCYGISLGYAYGSCGFDSRTPEDAVQYASEHFGYTFYTDLKIGDLK